MSAGHIPGPWKRVHDYICDREGVILAKVTRTCGTDSQVLANAELIARAPETKSQLDGFLSARRALDAVLCGGEAMTQEYYNVIASAMGAGIAGKIAGKIAEKVDE